MQETGANTTLIFVPARFATDAIYEAVDAGIGTVICITEHIPAHDMLRVYTYIRGKGVTMIGPNCPGVLSPGKANVGIIPAEIFSEGSIGLVSRSGTLTYQIGHELTQLGLGNSTIVGIGGDPVVGSSFIDVLERFEADPETELIVLVGEIGGDEEEKAARYVQDHVTKPVLAYIAGLLGAARQDDGPRGRDHLRLVGHGAGEEGSAGGRGHPGRHDTDRGRADRGRALRRPRCLHSADGDDLLRPRHSGARMPPGRGARRLRARGRRARRRRPSSRTARSAATSRCASGSPSATASIPARV